ncbi:MAG: hypothetical protein ACFBZ8_08780 [Opitutales bacterium]
MSENIAHIALLNDGLRLLLASASITESFHYTAREQVAVCRLGSITRWGDRFTVGLLERIRDEWPDAEKRPEASKRLAFVIGWMSHRAADRQVKPLLREVEPEPLGKPRECTIYHDAVVYRNVFQNQPDDPYAGVFDAAAKVAIDAKPEMARASQLAETLLQAQLIRLHTFIPEPDDVWAWIGNVSSRIQHFQDSLPRYAKAILDPDPELWRKFVEEPNYYDSEDPIVAQARALENEHAMQVPMQSTDPLANLVVDAHSHYGQALQLGLTYMVAASRFFDREISAEDLHEAFKIGVPGRDGLGV